MIVANATQQSYYYMYHSPDEFHKVSVQAILHDSIPFAISTVSIFATTYRRRRQSTRVPHAAILRRRARCG
jgi:hypothetical protein